ncbi:MAG TPA: hypothetical protein VHA11_04310 [Bryobacteraceae bacterium]|nr:hypothetical protein [Bryobacteraceae bacterium]
MDFPTRLALRTSVLFTGMCLLAHPASQQGLNSTSIPLRVVVGPECDVRISGTGAGAGETEGAYRWIAGSLRLRYKIRTGAASGGGAIHMRLAPLGESAAVAYSVAVKGAGAPVNAEQPLTGSGTPEFVVVRFGPDQHTGSRGDTASVSWRVRYPAAQERSPMPAPHVRCTAY